MDLRGFGGGHNHAPPPRQQQGSSGLGFGPSIANGLDNPGAFGPGAAVQQSAMGQLDVTFIQGDQIVARVGDDVILLSEVFPQLPMLHRNPQLINDQTLQEVRQTVEAGLPQLITMRLVIQDFRRNVPEENRGQALQQFVDYFNEKMIPNIMKEAKVSTRKELVNALQENGMTLDQIRRSQVDTMVMQVWLDEQTRVSTEFTREELLEYYTEHAEEFDFPSRARWEQLTVSKQGRTNAEAYNKLSAMGNAVVRRGVPFAQVAKVDSDGATAADGGVFDWTTQGSLVSKKLDEAIFSLPVGQMSPTIIEDENAFHIIRVTERQLAGRKAFEEVQDELRQALAQERRAEKAKEYLAELKETIPVASILDGTLRTGGQGPNGQGLPGQGFPGQSSVQPASATIGDRGYPGQY
mgnify:CR=1 FL=1